MSDAPNPYESPRTDARAIRRAWWSIGVVAASTVVFALLGAALGAVIALAAPGYYRSVFSTGDEPWFQPLHVGLGLGATQGATAGGFIGLAIVAIWALRSRFR